MTLEERLKATMGDLLFNQCALADQIDRANAQVQKVTMELEAAKQLIVEMTPKDEAGGAENVQHIPPLPRAKKTA